MLAAARNEYVEQAKITASAVLDAQRLATRGAVLVAQSVQTYQAEAVALSLGSLGAVLGEQGIDTAQDAVVAPVALLTGVHDLGGMLVATDTQDALLRLVQTMVRDAGRTARAVDQATRPAVTGYVRSLQPPSCGRCAVLAGHVYRYSEGFQRHPALRLPDDADERGDRQAPRHGPNDHVRAGADPGLSAADVEAVKAGADLAQVVNVRRKAAGLTVGSSVVARAGRLTPQGCLSLATDRADALRLLRRYGYIT
jgi:hypothetical protein